MVLYIANNISAQLQVNFIVLLFTHQSVSVEQFFKAPSVMQPAKYDICKALITVSMRIALQLKLWGRVGLHISLWNGFCRRLSGALRKIILHPWGSNRNDTMIINVFLFKNVKGWSFGAGLPISDELCTLFYIFFTFFFSFALIFVSNVYCQDKNYIN